MRLCLLLVALASCAPTLHAETFMRRNTVLAGPRWVTVTGGDDDVRGLEHALALKGFRVSRGIPHVTTTLPTKYVLNIDGICTSYGSGFVAGIGVQLNELHVELFDATVSERVFAAHLNSDSDCPAAFFAEVADALERNWDRRATDP